MSGNYTYFIASLPLLLLEGRLPFSSETFFKMCGERLSGEEVVILKSAGRAVGPEEKISQPILKGWLAFDTALRNELVRIRAVRRKRDGKYIRGDGYADPSISTVALKAARNPSILEAERALDEARWHALDSLELGNYFNINFLIIYVIKLSILEKWEKIRAADGRRLVENAIHREPVPSRG